MYQVIDPSDGPTTGTWRCQVHRGCVHNELTALYGRVLGTVPEPTPEGIADLKKGMSRIGRMLKTKNIFERLPYQTILDQYSGSKRTRYERAALDLAEGPVEKRDARVTAFVKAEKRQESDEKDPRLIQFRTPKYNLELATYLKPVEHALLRHRGPRRGLRRTFVIAKGRDSVERARLIKEKWDAFGDPVCVSIDSKRFDKHVSAQALKAEHGVYNSIYSDSYLAKLLSWQVLNKGKSMNGIRYKVKGNRMSGDYNTGMGNCLLVAAMVEQYLMSLTLKRWDYFTDADDCLVFCEREDLDRVLATMQPYFLRFGQEVTIDKVAFEFWDIRHCQAAPLETGAGLRMIRDWRKVLSQAFAGYNHYHDPKGGMRVMKSTAQCELVLNAGVPILQTLSTRILTLLDPLRFARVLETDKVVWLAGIEARRRHFALFEARAVEVTAASRACFERVFGLTSEQQLAWEEWLEGLDFENIDLSRLRAHFPAADQGYY